MLSFSYRYIKDPELIKAIRINVVSLFFLITLSPLISIFNIPLLTKNINIYYIFFYSINNFCFNDANNGQPVHLLDHFIILFYKR